MDALPGPSAKTISIKGFGDEPLKSPLPGATPKLIAAPSSNTEKQRGLAKYSYTVPKDIRPICSNCNKKKCDFYCGVCNDELCGVCWKEFHSLGNSVTHTKNAFMFPCENCDTRRALVECDNCESRLCKRCSARLHQRGTRRGHKIENLCDKLEEPKVVDGQGTDDHSPIVDIPVSLNGSAKNEESNYLADRGRSVSRWSTRSASRGISPSRTSRQSESDESDYDLTASIVVPPQRITRTDTEYHFQEPVDPKRSEFIRRFQLPKDEQLLGHYVCALQRTILLQGRLYVSTNYICFYSHVFTFKTRLKIPIDQVIEIKEKETIGFIPNALKVYTKQEGYFFTSFWSRDESVELLNKVLSEYRKTHAQSDDDFNEVDYPVSSVDSGSEHSDEETEAGQSEAGESILDQPKLERTRSEWAIEEEELPDDCDMHFKEIEKLKMDEVMDQVFPMNSQDLFKYCFSDKAKFSLKQFFQDSDCNNVKVTKWVEHENLGQTRSVSFIMKLNGLPSFVAVDQTVVIRTERHRRAKNKFAMCARIDTPDVPWGTSFQIYIKWDVFDESDNTCRAKVTAGVHFLKRVFGISGTIEKRSKQDSKKNHDEWLEQALASIENYQRSKQLKDSDKPPQKVPVDDQPSSGAVPPTTNLQSDSKKDAIAPRLIINANPAKLKSDVHVVSRVHISERLVVLGFILIFLAMTFQTYQIFALRSQIDDLQRL